VLFTTAPPAADGPQPAPDQPLECSTSLAPPVVDTAITGVQIARVLFAAQAKDHDYRDFPINRATDIALGAGLLTVFAISAFYGYGTTAACSEAKDRHAEKSKRQLAPTSPLQSSSSPPDGHAPDLGPVTEQAPAPAATVTPVPTAPTSDGGSEDLERNTPF
jgi:hypothetical protein